MKALIICDDPPYAPNGPGTGCADVEVRRGDGIAPGAVGWLILTLRPGRCELGEAAAEGDQADRRCLCSPGHPAACAWDL